MRSTFFVPILLLAVAAFAACAPGPSGDPDAGDGSDGGGEAAPVVRNGTFEEAPDGENPLPGWSYTGAGGNYVTARAESSPLGTGGAMTLTATDLAVVTLVQSDSIVASAATGQTYTFTARFARVDGSNPSFLAFGPALLAAHPENGSATTSWMPAWTAISFDESGKGSASIEYVVGPEASGKALSVQVYVMYEASGVLAIDDVTVTKGATQAVPAPTGFANGDSEATLVPEGLYSQHIYGYYTDKLEYAGFARHNKAPAGFEGTQFAEFGANLQGTEGNALTPPAPVTAGKTYTVRLTYAVRSDLPMPETARVTITGGAELDSINLANAPPSGWATTGTCFTATEADAAAGVTVKFTLQSNMNRLRRLLVDDLKLTEISGGCER